MRIHYIIHVEFEKLGAIKTWAEQHRYDLQGTNIYRGESLPNMNEFDFLISLGGPQSVTELERYAYLQQEVAFIQQAIAAGKLLLGICLGAQLIGHALGAPGQHSPQKEVGCFPVSLTSEGQQHPLFEQLPTSFDVMHWHDDMVGLPIGATILAKSTGCPRQMIQFTEQVYGLQCHMEFTQQNVKNLITHCLDDLADDGLYIQEANVMLQSDFSRINQLLYKLLDAMVGIYSKNQT
ncbi:MAG: homoserine O-succinyltransferase [Gammaproteobacteria bacterium]|nr:homoserine O-succinyltransferase [Gammaproteobacteria bacterium]